MAIFESEVWFSVVKNDENPYDLTVVPFAFYWQFCKSEQILIIDHETLHKIASRSYKPNGNCILINMSGRSGSTLLNQVSQFSRNWNKHLCVNISQTFYYRCLLKCLKLCQCPSHGDFYICMNLGGRTGLRIQNICNFWGHVSFSNLNLQFKRKLKGLTSLA